MAPDLDVDQQALRILDAFLEADEERYGFASVDDPMIVAQC